MVNEDNYKEVLGVQEGAGDLMNPETYEDVLVV